MVIDFLSGNLYGVLSVPESELGQITSNAEFPILTWS